MIILLKYGLVFASGFCHFFVFLLQNLLPQFSFPYEFLQFFLLCLETCTQFCDPRL